MVVQKKLYTCAEYAAISDLPENQHKILELIEGEIVEKTASFAPSRIAMRIGRLIGNHAEEHDLGYVTGEAGGYILSDEDTFNPEVGYISKKRLPEEPDCEVNGPLTLL